MSVYGFKMPPSPRKTFLYDLEENWYVPLFAERKGLKVQSIKRSNFGEYDMAVNYLGSVLEEAAAVNSLAIYNIDHMAQLRFTGKDVCAILDRALTGNMSEMKIGACKYTLLLNEHGGVQDDMILMRMAQDEYIAVINAGHDITDHGLVADIDRIMSQKHPSEEVQAEDISDALVKVDIQGPLSYKLIKTVFGNSVLKNRHQPDKNMNYFTFNEFERNGGKYIISRTGYTNRWGWELYLPVENAEDDFKEIVSIALDLGGMLVGLGGRDENRISAGAFGLPLMGSEYDPEHTPVNAPLFSAAVDLGKPDFVGKAALVSDLGNNPTKSLFVCVSEGIAAHRKVYLGDECLGTVTSSINSPNLTLEQRLLIGSQRRNVNASDGNAAIGLAWLYRNPFLLSSLDNPGEVSDQIPVKYYKIDETGNPTGVPLAGYLTRAGISPATAPKALKNIETL